jgi:hypothetical protein
MGDTSDREQTESGSDLTEQIRGRVDEAEQLLNESAKRVGAAAERVRQAQLQAEQAQRIARLAQEHIDSTRARAARAKDRELAAHLRAEKLHTDAAKLQQRLGHPAGRPEHASRRFAPERPTSWPWRSRPSRPGRCCRREPIRTSRAARGRSRPS